MPGTRDLLINDEGVLALTLAAGSMDRHILVFPDGVKPVFEIILLLAGVNVRQGWLGWFPPILK